MKLKDIVEIVDGHVICGHSRLQEEVDACFASDLMSDVLTLQTSNIALITGLMNIQTVRTAEMADISYIILVRKKKILPEVQQIACENNMVIVECPYSMFKACGLLYKAGIKPVY